MKNSSLYIGNVTHQRFFPKNHFFKYGLVLFYLDLSSMEDFPAIPFLYSFNPKDYLKAYQKKGNDLIANVRDVILERTSKISSGPIRILTQIRYLGFCFNPVSFYYCFDPEDKKVEFIVAEITNTPWYERKVYVFECNKDLEIEKFSFDKNFHVSPFMPMELIWDWKFKKPNHDKKTETLFVHMEDWSMDREKHMFNATLNIKPVPLSRLAIVKNYSSISPINHKTISGHLF